MELVSVAYQKSPFKKIITSMPEIVCLVGKDLCKIFMIIDMMEIKWLQPLGYFNHFFIKNEQNNHFNHTDFPIENMYALVFRQ